MTTREELQHLSIDDLIQAHNLLDQCLTILNSDNSDNSDDKEILSFLTLNCKNMTLQLELAKIAIFARILELDELENSNTNINTI